MKKTAFLLLAGILVMYQLDGHVDLSYPEGGETFHPGDAVNVTWAEVARHNFLGWHLLFSENGGDTWDTIEINMPLETLEYRWIVPSMPTSKGRIRIIQDNEEQDYTGTSNNFTITFTSGIDNSSRPGELKMYPNPLTDYTSLEFENPMHSKHSLIIYNTQGSIVRSFQNVTSGKIRVERNQLTAGLYIILVRDEDELLAVGRLAVE